MALRPQRLFVLALAAFAFLAQGCAEGSGTRGDGTNADDTSGSSDTNHDGGVPPVASETPAPEANSFADRDANELFAWDTLPTFEATLPAERWSYLKDHALEEAYEPAEVHFEGESLGTVGLRFKGSVGTLTSCVDGQGSLICPKLSMKLAFDEYEPTTRFFHLKRLNLHAMSRDDSKLRERLGYDLFRHMGIFAPRSAWAILRVNGESLGLFSMVEQIDGRFTADRFPDDPDGNLYKEAWPVYSEAAYYEEHLETDPVDDAAALHSVAVALGSELSMATDAAEQSAALARYMDLDYLARYMAVDDAIANVDGVTATYTGADPNYYQNHNHYLYLEQKQPRLWLLPWDLDATFLPRGDFEVVPRWNATDVACDQTYVVWGEVNVVSPACDVLFQAMAFEPSAYRAAVDELLADAFSEETLSANIDRHAAFIEAGVAADPLGPGLASWQAAVEALKQRVPLLRERLQNLKDGRTTSPFELSIDEANDFETETVGSLALGVAPLSNTRSTIGASLGRTAALLGEQDLRLDFIYRNEGDPPLNPWGQWSYIPLRFQGAPLALSTLTGMRLLLRADSPRTVRIDLDSSQYEAQSEGIKFGWEVQVGSTLSEVEVRFADAALPSWARVTTDDLGRVLNQLAGIAFQPFCLGRDAQGFLPAGIDDSGFLEVDHIEFF